MTHISSKYNMFQLEQFGGNHQEGVFSIEMQQSLGGLQGHMKARNPSMVIVESSPLYSYPSMEYPTQAINHPASLNAQSATTEVMSLMRSLGIPTQHWVMIDDVNNRVSPNAPKADIFEAFLAESTESSLYRRISHLAWESDFQQDELDQCGIMDARFQLSKLKEATRHFTELESLPMLLTIHPVAFQTQQRFMIESLGYLLKSDPDACVIQLPKSMKKRLALEPFVHIWTDEQGIDSITVPQMINGSIQHIAISDR